MLNKLKSRDYHIIIAFSLVFLILLAKLAIITIAQGEYYKEEALNKMLKKIPIVAKRGEIRDVNGKILAGNIPAFTVNLLNSSLTTKDFDNVAISVFDLLDPNGEYELSMPIVYENGHFIYSADERILQWLNENGYEDYVDAQVVYDDIKERENISSELDYYEVQRFLLLKGINLPISVKSMKYLQELEKDRFLEEFNIETDLSAEEAFKKLREYKSFKVSEEYDDYTAYKIIMLRYAVKQKGYRKYEPIRISSNVDKERAVKIEEMSMDLPGISVDVEPIRYYPYKEQAAHVLGYMGKISTEGEIEKYVKENKYLRSDIIGKVGIEGNYELDLRGENGFKYIEVDVYGQLVRNLNESVYGIANKASKAGKDIDLTIDIDIQKNTYENLEKALKAIQVGGTYKSKWGDYKYQPYPKAESGAVVAVNVKTGEIITLVNYPSYDVNLFSTGISLQNWRDLQPDNVRNPLAPRPLYNTATRTAVQPGSTYKMITGFAALEEGLDPYLKIFSDGYIDIGNNRFGCWLWNTYRAKHGPTNLFEAIEVSCNYYMYNISTGYNHYKDEPLDFDMDTKKLLEYTKKFGLNDPTGIEISESVKGVPDPEKKRKMIIWGLERKLDRVLDEYFPEEMMNNEKTKENIKSTIVSWADENPSRGTLIRRLIELGANDDYYIVQNLADIIKYDYFTQLKWFKGDTFNLAIGQGGHQYTPIQMARYIATVANDGYLKPLSIIKSVDSVELEKEETEFINQNDNMKFIRQAMLRVINGKSGTARTAFVDFPIQAAGKTGTAEKDGRIPPKDEVKYILSNLRRIAPYISKDALQEKTDEILKNRHGEISSLQLSKKEIADEEELNKIDEKIVNLVKSGYLTERSSMREALKVLSNDKITNEDIDQFRDTYDNYAWFVSFAPYDDPEIAVVVMIPQGGHGGYGAPVARDLMADYFKLKTQEEVEQEKIAKEAERIAKEQEQLNQEQQLEETQTETID